MTRNRRLVVAAYPDALPGPEHFRLEDAPMPEPAEGQALVRTAWLGMDPFPRMQLAPARSGPPPIPLGAVMPGRGAGRVVESRGAALRPGDWVAADLGWQDYAVVDAAAARRLDPEAAPVQASLGLLGPSGLAALLMLTEAGRAAAGETVAVTAAAGAVGSAACQVARLLGCRVVAIGRGPVQTAFLRDELRADVAADGADLSASGGIDLAVDTVGGALHEALLTAMRPRGRIVMGGFISGYAGARPRYTDPHAVIFKRLTLTGFLAGDHAALFDAGLARLAAWLRDGGLRRYETVTEGLENAPRAFASLFTDAPPGKQLVRVADLAGTPKEPP